MYRQSWLTFLQQAVLQKYRSITPTIAWSVWHFQDADIRNVLKVLAFKSGVNIVAAPDVTGVVNIQLKDVPWQKALGVILSTYG